MKCSICGEIAIGVIEMSTRRFLDTTPLIFEGRCKKHLNEESTVKK